MGPFFSGRRLDWNYDDDDNYDDPNYDNDDDHDDDGDHHHHHNYENDNEDNFLQIGVWQSWELENHGLDVQV